MPKRCGEPATTLSTPRSSASNELPTTSFDRAAADRRIIISGDADFTAMLAERGSRAPSLIFFRVRGRRRAAEQAALLLANLDAVADELNGGAIVVLQDERVRVRRLPLDNESAER